MVPGPPRRCLGQILRSRCVLVTSVWQRPVFLQAPTAQVQVANCWPLTITSQLSICQHSGPSTAFCGGCWHSTRLQHPHLAKLC